MSVTLGAELIQSETVGSNTEQIWEVPAIREKGAIRKIRAAAELKGLRDVTVLDTQETGSKGLPGQTVFRITIEAPR